MSATTTTPNTLKTLTSTKLHDQLRQAMAQWQASAKTHHVSKALAALTTATVAYFIYQRVCAAA